MAEVRFINGDSQVRITNRHTLMNTDRMTIAMSRQVNRKRMLIEQTGCFNFFVQQSHLR